MPPAGRGTGAMIGTVFALLAACCNALASVMQRQAALTIPDDAELRPRIVGYLLRQPVWYVAMVALLGGFLFQATALNADRLAVVQPLLITELPLTLLLAGVVFRRRLGSHEWLAVVAISVGLAVLLVSADPSAGHAGASAPRWLLTVSTAAAAMAALLVAGVAAGPGGARAGLFGAASGIGFGLTAAFIKATTGLLDQGLSGLLTSWPPYAMIAAGATALFLTQNAYQAGTLAAAQPAITIADPLVSVALGVVLFDEQLRGGLAMAPEIIGATLIVAGTVVLARSPLVVASPHMPPPADHVRAAHAALQARAGGDG
jgi:drug/metabolite transporter (DMT)-like permease